MMLVLGIFFAVAVFIFCVVLSLRHSVVDITRRALALSLHVLAPCSFANKSSGYRSFLFIGMVAAPSDL